jgi:hypothetical protein
LQRGDKDYNFCGRDDHLESKCFNKMEALEAVMKKHNINLDSSSSKSYFHGHAIYVVGFPSIQHLLLPMSGL